jgi:hypothetical protein
MASLEHSVCTAGVSSITNCSTHSVIMLLTLFILYSDITNVSEPTNSTLRDNQLRYGKLL